MALDIRRGLLMIASAIRRGFNESPPGAADTLVGVLEAMADGIRDRYGATDDRTQGGA